MERVTVRDTTAELPSLSDELARVQTLDAGGGSLSRFELAGSRMRALNVENVHLVDGSQLWRRRVSMCLAPAGR